MRHDSFIWQYCDDNPEVELVELDVLPKYWILSNGLIYSKQTDKFLKTQKIGNHGYERLLIRYDGKYRNMRVHRLVAMAFLDDPKDPLRNEVDHINHHRGDNRIENLRWVTRTENARNKKSNHMNHNQNLADSSHYNDTIPECKSKKLIIV